VSRRNTSTTTQQTFQHVSSGGYHSTGEEPDLLTRLRQQLSLPLPGIEYQLKMAHLTRAVSIPMRPDVRKAAVLVLLFQSSEEWRFVLIRRKSIEGDVHAGQYSFPGGRAQANESLEAAALRETFEEIGSPPELITTLGQLTQLHIPVSNHLVYPMVGFLSQHQPWQAQESEVDIILEVPLQLLAQEEIRTFSSIQLRDGVVLSDVPVFDLQDHIVWGATAMILNEFITVLNRAGLLG